MDLKIATERDIKNELARREMLKQHSEITDRINAIVYAYNCGIIEGIKPIDIRINTNEPDASPIYTKGYIVRLKKEAVK
jgi:hypothetical protein